MQLTEAKLRVYRGLFDMLMQGFLTFAAVGFLFWCTYKVFANPGLSTWVAESGSFGGTVFVVFKFWFQKRVCRKCGTAY